MKALKKNQVIIFVIALMLVAAGYLSYDAQGEVPVSIDAINNNELAEIGDAKLVNANETQENTINNTIENSTLQNNVSQTNTIQNNTTKSNQTITTNAKQTDDYFITSRLGRDTMYSQIIDSYQKIIDNEGIAQEQKAIATQEISKVNNTKNAIMISENLIKTKGFDDVVIFVNDKSISVILKGENIEQDKIAQVQNIIARELNSDIQNIHISNK